MRLGVSLEYGSDMGSFLSEQSYAAVWSSSGTLMGGVKDSGLGTRHGPHGIEKFTEPQSVVVQRLMPVTGPRSLSRPRFEALATVSLRLLRRVPGAR